MIEVTEKAIQAHVDGVWHGYVRARFTSKIVEAIKDESLQKLYIDVKKRVKAPDRINAFIKGCGRGEFVGLVIYQSFRTAYGD